MKANLSQWTYLPPPLRLKPSHGNIFSFIRHSRRLSSPAGECGHRDGTLSHTGDATNSSTDGSQLASDDTVLQNSVVAHYYTLTYGIQLM